MGANEKPRLVTGALAGNIFSLYLGMADPSFGGLTLSGKSCEVRFRGVASSNRITENRSPMPKQSGTITPPYAHR
jgi:hypothetical protein